MLPEVWQPHSHSLGLGLVLLSLFCKSLCYWASANALYQGVSSLVGVQTLVGNQSSLLLHLLRNLMLSNTVEKEHLYNLRDSMLSFVLWLGNEKVL